LKMGDWQVYRVLPKPMAPPMITIRLMSAAADGNAINSSATLVKGPVAIMV
jgi:hypothetical protein